MKPYELKFATGTEVTAHGDTGPDAAHRYVAEHPGAVVVAWRDPQRHGLVVGYDRHARFWP